MNKLASYGLLKVITNVAISLLLFALIFATIDYYFFEEIYRAEITVLGFVASSALFLGTVVAIVRNE